MPALRRTDLTVVERSIADPTGNRSGPGAPFRDSGYYIPLQPAPEIGVKIGKERVCGLHGHTGTHCGATDGMPGPDVQPTRSWRSGSASVRSSKAILVVDTGVLVMSAERSRTNANGGVHLMRFSTDRLGTVVVHFQRSFQQGNLNFKSCSTGLRDSCLAVVL